MDILDTFGDWVQLFFFAALYIGIAFGSAMLVKKDNLAGTGLLLGNAFFMWTLVYDYDIVLAYILGPILSFILALNVGVRLGGPDGAGDDPGHRIGFMLWHSLTTVIIMIVKIVRFW